MQVVISLYLEIFQAKRIATQDNKASWRNPILIVEAMCLYVQEREERYQLDDLKWKI